MSRVRLSMKKVAADFQSRSEMALIPAGMPHMTLNPGPGPLKFLAILNNSRGSEPMVVDCFREEPWVSHFTPIEYPPV